MTSNQENDNTRTHIVLSSGTAVSHYKIISKIGAGGMGEVYLAEDTALNRNVAIKFLPVHLSSDPDFKARFKREAQSAAKLNHPNIITVYEVGEHLGRPYFVMEHIEGRTLKEIILGEKLDTDKIINLAIQICDGLGAAHDKGVVHRDIKPSNIAIDAYGRPKILDFGLASIQGGEQLTKTGSTLGTVRYMSPEQVEGKPLDNRSDLFSFGVVFYELLTGQSPFGRDSDIATVNAISTVTPEPLARYSSGVSNDIQRIVSKLLEKDPSLRYQTASGLLSDLKQLMSSSQSAITTKPAKKKSILIPAVIAGVVIVVAVVAQIYFWPSEDADKSGAKTMLAVLPFENLGSPDDEYFAAGITDEITARLATVRGLGIIARTSVMGYKGTTKTIPQIGAELGVEYILEGTVRWQKSTEGPDRVRITPQLINVSDGAHAWANVYDEVLAEVFKVQTDVAKSIVEALGVALLDPEREALERKTTENLQAYDFFLKGNEYWNQVIGGTGKKSLLLSLQLYENAVKAEPDFASAQARLARTLVELYWHHTNDSVDIIRAKQAIDLAMKIDPDDPDVRIASGSYFYHNHEHERALAEFRIAQRIQPNNADLMREIAYVYRRQGRGEEALNEMLAATKLDPLSIDNHEQGGYTAMYLRKYEIAEDLLNRAISLGPDKEAAYGDLAWLEVMRSGDLDKARETLARLKSPVNNVNSEYKLFKAFVAFYSGDNELALSLFGKLKNREAPGMNFVGRAYVEQEMGNAKSARTLFDSARIYLESELETEPNIWNVHASLGIAYAGLGMRVKALFHGQEGIRTNGNAFLIDRQIEALAIIYLFLGDKDLSINKLEKLLAMQGLNTANTLRLNPVFKPLRDHPRFQALIKKYET